MDFRLADDQAVLIEGVRDFLAGTHGPETLRALDADPSRRSATIAASLIEMGLTGLVIPETHGGLGLGLVEAALIALECGRVGLAEPFIDSAFVAAPLLVRTGGQGGLLSAIAAGEARVALQHALNPWVADLDGATQLLAADGEQLTLGPAPPADTIESVDPLRRLAKPVATTGETIGVESGEMLDLAALMASAQALGTADAMLSLAVEYAKTRVQFGQPIGAFQAIKHHLATAMVAIEFARPVLLRAAQALDEGNAFAPIHVSHAKLLATDAAMAMAETAIQVHGAMGYTYEVDLHFWMKRAWAMAGAWGDRAFHLARVEAAVISRGMPIGPAETFI